MLNFGSLKDVVVGVDDDESIPKANILCDVVITVNQIKIIEKFVGKEEISEDMIGIRATLTTTLMKRRGQKNYLTYDILGVTADNGAITDPSDV